MCWANENWTKHWDGGEREILLEQSYDPATLAAIIADAVSHAADPRYIRVDGRALKRGVARLDDLRVGDGAMLVDRDLDRDIERDDERVRDRLLERARLRL